MEYSRSVTIERGEFIDGEKTFTNENGVYITALNAQISMLKYNTMYKCLDIMFTGMGDIPIDDDPTSTTTEDPTSTTTIEPTTPPTDTVPPTDPPTDTVPPTDPPTDTVPPTDPPTDTVPPTDPPTDDITDTVTPTEDITDPPIIFEQIPLTFETIEDGTFQFEYIPGIDPETGEPIPVTTTIDYSVDNGSTWVTLPANTNTSTIAAGSKIMWKGNLTPQSYNGIGTFSATGNFIAYGNIMSLLYSDNFVGQIDLTGKDYTFYCLFSDNNKIINAQNLILPATTLANNCYHFMFADCTSLTTAPDLPAILLNDYCYSNMFQGCTSLTTAPELPAILLNDYCYSQMFFGCTSLTTAPTLPATTLAIKCYYGMFHNCTSLTTAPTLSATTLAINCYEAMFSDCTSLTTVPELSAITLVNNCYNYMFSGCTRLNYIKAMFTTTPSTSYTSHWVSGVSSTGTFVKNSAATWNVRGVNGIPSSWTIQNV